MNGETYTCAYKMRYYGLCILHCADLDVRIVEFDKFKHNTAEQVTTFSLKSRLWVSKF